MAVPGCARGGSPWNECQCRDGTAVQKPAVSGPPTTSSARCATTCRACALGDVVADNTAAEGGDTVDMPRRPDRMAIESAGFFAACHTAAAAAADKTSIRIQHQFAGACSPPPYCRQLFASNRSTRSSLDLMMRSGAVRQPAASQRRCPSHLPPVPSLCHRDATAAAAVAVWGRTEIRRWMWKLVERMRFADNIILRRAVSLTAASVVGGETLILHMRADEPSQQTIETSNHAVCGNG